MAGRGKSTTLPSWMTDGIKDVSVSATNSDNSNDKFSKSTSSSSNSNTSALVSEFYNPINREEAPKIIRFNQSSNQGKHSSPKNTSKDKIYGPLVENLKSTKHSSNKKHKNIHKPKHVIKQQKKHDRSEKSPPKMHSLQTLDHRGVYNVNHSFDPKSFIENELQELKINGILSSLKDNKESSPYDSSNSSEKIFFRIGETVFVSSDSSHKARSGTVIAIRGPSAYDIEYSDGELESSVSTNYLTPKSPKTYMLPKSNQVSSNVSKPVYKESQFSPIPIPNNSKPREEKYEAKFYVGESVIYYDERLDNWFPSKIIKARKNGEYDVEFINGTVEIGVPSMNLRLENSRPLSNYSPIPFKDTQTNSKKKSKRDIYDDDDDDMPSFLGDLAQDLRYSKYSDNNQDRTIVEPIKNYEMNGVTFHVGNQIEFKEDSGEWRKGTITKILKNGTYYVEFLNEEILKGVPHRLLRIDRNPPRLKPYNNKKKNSSNSEPIESFYQEKIEVKVIEKVQPNIPELSSNNSRNDINSICKFYLKGICKKGNECQFLHSVVSDFDSRKVSNEDLYLKSKIPSRGSTFSNYDNVNESFNEKDYMKTNTSISSSKVDKSSTSTSSSSVNNSVTHDSNSREKTNTSLSKTTEISNMNSIDKSQVKSNSVTRKANADDLCGFCGKHENKTGSALVCCSSCEITCHVTCKGKIGKHTKEGIWKCPKCLADPNELTLCVMCFRSSPKLLLVKTDSEYSNSWYHPLCARVKRISNPNPDPKNQELKQCIICQDQYALTKCPMKTCESIYHPSCAYEQRWNIFSDISLFSSSIPKIEFDVICFEDISSRYEIRCYCGSHNDAECLKNEDIYIQLRDKPNQKIPRRSIPSATLVEAPHINKNDNLNQSSSSSSSSDTQDSKKLANNPSTKRILPMSSKNITNTSSSSSSSSSRPSNSNSNSSSSNSNSSSSKTIPRKAPIITENSTLKESSSSLIANVTNNDKKRVLVDEKNDDSHINDFPLNPKKQQREENPQTIQKNKNIEFTQVTHRLTSNVTFAVVMWHIYGNISLSEEITSQTIQYIQESEVLWTHMIFNNHFEVITNEIKLGLLSNEISILTMKFTEKDSSQDKLLSLIQGNSNNDVNDGSNNSKIRGFCGKLGLSDPISDRVVIMFTRETLIQLIPNTFQEYLNDFVKSIQLFMLMLPKGSASAIEMS